MLAARRKKANEKYLFVLVGAMIILYSLLMDMLDRWVGGSIWFLLRMLIGKKYECCKKTLEKN
jgi:hypothetical protein